MGPKPILGTINSSAISTFVNDEGKLVHAAFAPVKIPGGRTVNRHQGTFATRAEAEQRLADVAANKPEKWEEPE